ncbi:MAG TPA: heparin lyase I family protein [Opitutaceae bacterium]|nr:heparin lyase I family protein [Opitutaceae bacterium]
MNTRLPAGVVVIFAALASAPCGRSVTATGLSSFDAIEEPLVKFYPATGRFEPDALVNITDLGNGRFRMFARYNSEWWDGDRDTLNKDRQRMEVKGLGPHQMNGETFEYSTTWRSNPGFRGANGFCHIFQLKATNGDSASPLITLSIHGDKATVEANSIGPKIIAREFPWRPAKWQTVKIRVKTSSAADGAVLVSVDGDDFQGKNGVAIARPDADEYRPKWGLYRKAVVDAPMGDDFIEHQGVTAQKVGSRVLDTAVIEVAARQQAATSSPAKALAKLAGRDSSPEVDFAIASIATLWAETDPAAAMAWADAQKNQRLRQDATARIFSRWADRDVAAAAKWLHTHAPNASMDQIVWLFVTDTTYRYVRREIALEAAPLIQEPALRAKAFEHVVEIWARTEPEAAARFVEKSPALTGEQKQAMVGRIRR